MRNSNFFFLVLVMVSLETAAQGPLKGRDENIKGPQSFAIVVGVSHYRYIRPLAFADKDAELFRDWLRSPAGGKLKDDNIFCLLNDQANNSNFWGKGFQWLKKKDLQSGDKLFIYLAGHGDAIDEDQYFFLGYDCKPDGDKNNYLVNGAIQLFNLKKKIAKETSKGVNVFFIMDACRSNELPGGTEGQNFLNTAISQKQTGEVMMLATAAGQESLEDASIGNGHGLFTWYLVDGLTGMADAAGKPDGKISFGEISAYVDNNVASLAMQKFKKSQDPYFCCSENNDKVISTVDTAYLQQWLKIKKQLERRSGKNIFTDDNDLSEVNTADTALIETYNRFNRAVKNNRLTGNESAEDYFLQLNKKFPGNPYTLDAKSTLAVEYLNVAQSRVNRYLDCITDISTNDKQANYEAALNLEKAIASFREDDEDFATSLYGRLYLLKASGDFGVNGKNGDMNAALGFAYNGLAFDPKGAYILNKLAQLHMQNNNRDSALFYANKAVAIAPRWACAITTLALIQQSMEVVKKADAPKKKNSQAKPGIMVGGGIVISNPSFRENPNSTVLSANSESNGLFQLGVNYFVPVSKTISFRPSVTLETSTTAIGIQRRTASGVIIDEIIKIKQAITSLSLPFIFHLGKGNIKPYIAAGPSFNLMLGQDDTSSLRIPLKTFSVSGDLGIGVDLELKNKKMILSPELKYSHGFTDLKESANTNFTNSLTSLKRDLITLSFYLRRR